MAAHGLEHLEEVTLLSLGQSLDGAILDILVLGEDVVLDDLLAVAQEHVLGAAKADALSAKVKGQLGVVGVIGIGAHTHDTTGGAVETDLVSPLEDGLQVAGELRFNQLHSAQHYAAGGAVDGDDVALVEHHVGAGDLDLFVGGVDLQGLSAADAGAPMPRAITAA